MAVTHDPVTRGGEYRDRPRRWRTMSLRDVIFSAYCRKLPPVGRPSLGNSASAID
jgi:hypothetical protein